MGSREGLWPWRLGSNVVVGPMSIVSQYWGIRAEKREKGVSEGYVGLY